MAEKTEERQLAAGKQVARVLKEEGVEYMFGIGGGHITPLIVGFGIEAGVKLVHCRHEQAAGYAADAYARASGKVGVCFGTAGPGMTNMVSAIAQAYWCKSPVVAFFGQHDTNQDGRGALQEGFAEPIMGSITKWTRRIVDTRILAHWTKKAFRDAMTYPPGPVGLEIPRNLQFPKTLMGSQEGWVENSYPLPAPAQGDSASVEKAVRLLLSAERPVIAGGEDIFWADAGNELREFVELTQIPVITRRVARGCIPEDHPLAFSAGARGAILRASDVACTIGLILGHLEGYGRWAANCKLIQITQSQGDIEFTAPSAMVIIANPKAVLKQMTECARDLIKGSPRKDAWLNLVEETKATEKKRLEDEAQAVKNNTPLHPEWVAHEAAAVLNKDATIILDAFTGSAFLTRHFVARCPGAVLDSGNWAGVGHGIGMGIGAQLARPGRQVLVNMGDGGAGLGGFDVETAVRCKLPVVYLINNNSAWMSGGGPMFMKALQHVGSPDPYTPWAIAPTRYDQVFAAMGAYTERVESPAELRPALERAFASGKTAVVDVVVARGVPHPMTRGSRADEARRGLRYLDPEDVPEDFRARLFPEEKK
jgi:acetolactate synthase-1/2/3 large subunit